MLKSLFQNKTPDFLKICIDPSARPAGSAVRINGNRPKGNIVIKRQRPNRKTKKKQKKKRYKETETALLGVETGSSARASNSLTTVPQCQTYLEDLILLYQNHFSLR